MTDTSNLAIIGKTTGVSTAPNNNGIVPVVSIERPVFRAIIITALNGAFAINNLENVQTSKSDTGDAGTFSFSFPLGDPSTLLAVRAIGPMDVVAIFADRVTTQDANGYFLGQNIQVSLLTYGDAGATAVTQFQGTPSCIFVGMIDTVDEDMDFENATGTCDVAGRDLTKIFIDNDTLAPFTDPSGYPGMTNLYSLLLRRATSGRQFLLDVLQAFVKKDRQFIQQVGDATTTGATGSAAAAQTIVASDYGYDWDFFVTSQFVQPDATFLHFAGSVWLPNFAVSASSSWAAIQELKNAPLTRLFVTETGALIFDDQYTAWGFGQSNNVNVGATILATDVRHARFSRTDEDMVTAITVMPTVIGSALQALSSQFQVLQPFQRAITAIKRYGYRWLVYQSPWSGATEGVDKTFLGNLKAKAVVLDEMHNNMPRMTLTLKGRSDIRVGTRIKCVYVNQNGVVLWGPISASIRPLGAQDQVWYVESVQHSHMYGNDWTVSITARYPFPKGSPTV